MLGLGMYWKYIFTKDKGNRLKFDLTNDVMEVKIFEVARTTICITPLLIRCYCAFWISPHCTIQRYIYIYICLLCHLVSYSML